MKNSQKLMLSLLCGVLCFALITCASGGGGGGAPAAGGDPVVGVWEFEANKDANDGGTATVTMNEVAGEIDGVAVTFQHCFGEVTDATKYGLIDITFTPDEDTLALLKTARAISIKMLGDGAPYIIEAPISTVTDWGFHRYTINTEAGVVQDHYIEMRMFMQPPWAQPVRFNRERLTSLRITTRNAAEGGLGPFDFTIMEISLIP
jgi:hypothetical protein